MEKADPAIRIYKRKNDAGELVGWSADFKIPSLEIWANVSERGTPTYFYGSIYPTKDAAIEAARRNIKSRSE